jgi:hypothetical protein
MIDDVKTNKLREKIQKEKEKLEGNVTGQESKGVSLIFLFTIYLLFYGAQFIVLKKLNYIPLNMVESTIVFFALRNLYRKTI